VTVLEVDELTVRFGSTAVVDRVSFTLGAGERLGIIGESGSGKTLTALAILGLASDRARVSGSVRLDGEELLGARDRRLSALRGDQVAMVFQEPLTSLDPLMRVGTQMAESLRLHRGLSRRGAHIAALELAERVGLPDPERIARAWPHQLSGGQRQRVGIASALACGPSLLIADEPTTALDVTVQAEILSLLDALVVEQGSSLLFITHDLAVMAEVAQQVLVMQKGRVVDRGEFETILGHSEHAYTQKLLNAVRAVSWDGTGSPAGVTTAPTLATAPPPLPTVVPGWREALSAGGAPNPSGRGANGRTESTDPDRTSGPDPNTAVGEPLLEAVGLSRTYRLPRRSLTGPVPTVEALRAVDLTVHAGESLGIVGESGSGKSTLLRILLALDRPDAGELRFRGEPIGRPGQDLSAFRRQVQIVFQDPVASLDPHLTVRDIVAEPLECLRIAGDHNALIDAALVDVGLDPTVRARYPHEFSGGERQRIAIARALVPRPRILVGDEPVSALDVSVRAQILDLLRQLTAALELTLVLVSHDIGVVAQLCRHVVVMKDGAVVERGATADVLRDPQHPYTQRLLSSVPRLPAGAAS
jgi:ABC-type glutathione transport system ATPase component